MNEDELKQRTKRFSLRIIKLVAALPNTRAGRTIGGQLVRCGTSVGANYHAACRGRSKPDFIAKLGIVEEEADESAFLAGINHGEWTDARTTGLTLAYGSQRARGDNDIFKKIGLASDPKLGSPLPMRHRIANQKSKIQN